jgi:aspartyl-tRNA(Asn)/glutamyl-tRNA(Gln) amidotransferase subunit A
MHNLSAQELHKHFLDGKYTAVQIVETFLNRIKKLNPKVGAFLTVFNERALDKAKKLDEKKANGEKLGKLAGIPVAIKDNIHVKDEISTCASNFLTNFKAPFQSTVCDLIEEADGIIIGKTNLDEFAMGSSTEHSALQKTHNPWDLKCSPGGSSGGSAAAVGARLVPIALGSDTGGSIRQPASFCGVVGMKPTYGRVSRFGLVAFGSSLDQIGPFAKSAEDVALIMEVIGKHCAKDSTSIQQPAQELTNKLKSAIKGLKIGLPTKFLQNLDEEPKQIFEKAIETYKDLGAEIIDVDLSILKYSIAVYYILATAEASTNLARFDGIRYGRRSEKAQTLDEVYDFSKEEGFGPEVKRRIMLGTFVLSSGYQDAYYKKAQKVRTLIIQSFKKAFESCDLVAMPTTPGCTFETGSIQDPLKEYLEDIYTIPANLAGLPAISVPNGFSKEEKPYGIQLIGPQLHEASVLQAAYAFEKARIECFKTPKIAETV